MVAQLTKVLKKKKKNHCIVPLQEVDLYGMYIRLQSYLKSYLKRKKKTVLKVLSKAW